MLPNLLNPRSFTRSLQQIDEAPPSFQEDPANRGRRVAIVLGTAALSLLLLNYLRLTPVFYESLRILAYLCNQPREHFVTLVQASNFSELSNFTWWVFAHILAFWLIPLMVIRLLLKERVIDHGWRWGETHRHWKGYGLLLGVTLILVIGVASSRNDFLDHYPFYDLAHRSWLDLLLWEALYLTQFILLEFFFRGFLLQGLRPVYGSGAVWIMVVPYCMLHFPKLWLEATGSIFFGLFLGILALKSRSIWGGFLVHAGVAVGMDLVALFKLEQLPIGFWPVIN